MLFEQACCSGVEARANLTAEAVGVSMILAPLECGIFWILLHLGSYRIEGALSKPSSPRSKT
jgi:hypothetical protein